MVKNYAEILKALLEQYAKAKGLDHKKLIEELIQKLKRMKSLESRRVRRLKKERVDEFERWLDRSINPEELAVPRYRQRRFKEGDDRNMPGFRLSPKPAFKPRGKRPTLSPREIEAKPVLKLTPREEYLYIRKYSTVPVVKILPGVRRRLSNELRLDQAPALDELMRFNPELSPEANRLMANQKLLGQNTAGATNYTTNFATVVTEQSGELQKTLGSGQQDVLERKAEAQGHLVENSQERAHDEVYHQSLRAEFRHERQELRELDREHSQEYIQLARERVLDSQRENHQRFRQQIFDAKHHQYADDLNHLLAEAEIAHASRRMKAAPAA